MVVQGIAGAQKTPVVIRGESPELEVSIDWLTFTLPKLPFFDFFSESPVDLAPSQFLWSVLAQFAKNYLGADLETGFFPGKNFYKHSVRLTNGGFIAFGGNNVTVRPDGTEIRKQERFCVSLSGEACQALPSFKNLYSFLCYLNRPLRVDGTEVHFDPVNITRIDVAVDDHRGIYNIEVARNKYQLNEFAGKGRPPKAKYIDDFDSGEGKTLYVGNRAHGKMMRIYEKGKQLGDKLSSWVRWELELGAKDRVIPLDVLMYPKSYFVGAYPKALGFVSEAVAVIKTAKEKVRITYEHIRSVIRRQYGKYLNYAQQVLGLDPDSVVNEFLVSGIPERLKASLLIPDRELHSVAAT
ncbi:replication initiation factor domain-containing protein [Agaribacterium haliotis]|uniref:replication initiation factor domain-containing protein n=1 Tax=Agaribacterium haliotis TaxID=2013869 RepID=UPI0013044B78|nr:replication initiation factor domain-containing protein [Agaribacterium haliotis]